MELVKEIYTVPAEFPQREQYGLVSQMRRSAVSIPSNIAEGKKRGTKKDFVQFLRVADGSAAELETQLLLAKTLFAADCSKALELLLEVQKMLSVMIKKLITSTS